VTGLRGCLQAEQALFGRGDAEVGGAHVSSSPQHQPNLSQLYLSRLSLAKPAKLNFFKTPAPQLGGYGGLHFSFISMTVSNLFLEKKTF
jgi:hypothetical protein